MTENPLPQESKEGSQGVDQKRHELTVVGIGASAGGLAAVKAFFSHVPANSDLAFVVVMHLSPDHKSHLAELLQPHVKNPVQQVTETVRLETNRIYVIPPNANISTIDTHLRLSPLEEKRTLRAPIDHFFRTMSETHDGDGVAVILSGTGSDGALGIKKIKHDGGLAIAQDPNEAEYDGMPLAAIATGVVDLILPIEKMPGAIIRFARTRPKVALSPPNEDLDQAQRNLLQKVFAQLRARTGRDFSRYKRSTILRRIQRRMQLHHVEELPRYLELLRKSPEEVVALADEFLITVTSFFRDPEVFEKLEKELAQLSGDLQNLLAATDIATLFLDRDLRIMRFTPKVGELFNIRTTDRGRPLSEITHRLGEAELIEDAARVLRKLVPREREIGDEAGHWYLTRILPYRSSEDRIEGVVITFVDITERKRNEEALSRSEASFRHLVAAGAYAVYRMSPDWSEMRWLKGGGFISDTDSSDRSWFDKYIDPRDQPIVREAIRGAIRTKGMFELEHRVRRVDGTLGWTFSRAVPTLNEKGEISEWIGAAIDVTARRNAEEALRQSEERYRLIVEGAREYAIVMLDPDGRITMWSSGAQRLFGYTEEEALGRPGRLIFTEEDREAGKVEEEMETAAREGRASDDRWHLRKDGSRFWANGVMEALRTSDGQLRGYVKLLRDNTEKMQVEEERRRLNEALEEGIKERTRQVRELATRLSRAEQEERRRVSQILHDDLQQILCGVETKLALLRQELEDAGQASQLELLEAATGWLRQSIKTTRQLTVELSPPILSHEGLVDALEWLRRQMRDLHQLDMTLEATGHVVIADSNLRVLLFQAVRELLFNVKKHGKTGHALVQLEESPDLLTVRVMDEGAGMDLEEVASRDASVSGFGLFSIRERLRLIGGDLEIDTAPGEGTRVEIRAPLPGPDELLEGGFETSSS